MSDVGHLDVPRHLVNDRNLNRRSLMTQPKVAVVTGVSSGIGEATARKLGSEGYRVFGTVRSPEGRVPEGVERVVLDVRDEASIESGVASVLERADRIDVGVNDAGATIVG